MGMSRFTASTLDSYNTIYRGKTSSQIFTKSSLDKDLNPMDVKFREARDSEANPNSLPIILAVDVTGSMGYLSDQIIRKDLGVLFKRLIDEDIVQDPAIMTMAIGDAFYDEAPLQVGQFESDIIATQWLEKIYIEGGGGGNRFESYDLPYYFAANHTSIDSFEKRGKKGFLFTIGDEQAPEVTTLKSIKTFINKDGDGNQTDIPFSEVLKQASNMYNCYHIMIAEGNHASYYPDEVKNSWSKVMGQNAIWLKNHKKLADTIISIIEMNVFEMDIDEILDNIKKAA